jgi:hypothetical protein
LDGQSAVLRLFSDGSGGAKAFCYVDGTVWHADDSSDNFKGVTKMDFTGVGDNAGQFLAPTKAAFPTLLPYDNTFDTAGNFYFASFVTGGYLISKVDSLGNEAWSKSYASPNVAHPFWGLDGLGNPIRPEINFGPSSSKAQMATASQATLPRMRAATSCLRWRFQAQPQQTLGLSNIFRAVT